MKGAPHQTAGMLQYRTTKMTLDLTRSFRRPVDVVEANDIDLAEKVAILQAWAKQSTRGWAEVSMRIFTRCK